MLMVRADRCMAAMALTLALVSCLVSTSVTAAEPRLTGGGIPVAVSESAEVKHQSVPGTVAPAVSSAVVWPGRAKGVALYDFLEFWGDDAAGMKTAFSE